MFPFPSVWWLWSARSDRGARRRKRSPVHPYWPSLEGLEDRCVPSTWLVSNSGDDVAVPGTLRNAVANAAGGDTIVISPALVSTPIVLTHGELPLDKELIIRTAGDAPATVSGGGTTRVFEVTAGVDVVLAN